MSFGFELLLARRYLRADRPPGALTGLRWATFGLLLTTICIYIGDELLNRYLASHLSQFLWDLRPILRTLKYASVLVTVLVGFFVELIRQLTIFTTISTFGLFLGTGALVTVLSVMSGFEQDLKGKILGTHAHMVVTCRDRSFTDYREALAKVEKLPGVVAATPYLTSEVMIASQANLSGVIIKGIDPQTIGRVTELVKNTEQGSLENLLHPERMLTLGEQPPPRSALQQLATPLDAGGVADAADKSAELRDAGEVAPDAGTGAAVGDRSVTLKADAEGVVATEGQPRKSGSSGSPKPRKILPGVAIGRELAKNLRVFLGDDVNVVSPLGGIGPTGPIPKTKRFRVGASFFSGMYEYDSKYVYMDLPAAQKFLGLPDEVTGLELKLATPEETEGVMAQVQATLGSDFEVVDWKQTNRSLFSALKLEKIAMFIALCFIILVAAFSIVSNGIMLVLKKGRDVAILKSMGASDGAVLRVFVLLGLYMGMLGTTAGVLVGCAVCAAFDRFGLPLDTDVYYITKLPVKVNPTELAVVLVASLMLSLLATLYPAWLAARLRPVEGLR